MLPSFFEHRVQPGAFLNFTCMLEALAGRDLWPEGASPRRDNLPGDWKYRSDPAHGPVSYR